METKITILVAILFSLHSFAQVGTIFTADGLNYKITATTTVEVTVNPTTITGAFSIPSTIIYDSANYQITGISDSAFSGCKSLSSITIPNSITSIGRSAFNQCSSLTSVTIPNSVTSIGNFIFNQCSSLASVTIPDSVTSISTQAFSGCSSLNSVTIPSSITTIGSSAFVNCSSLTSVTIPNTVTSIGDNAFSGCSNLILINVGWIVPISINNNVFTNLENIATMTLYVPSGTEMTYKNALVWKNFQTISEPLIGSIQIGQKFAANGINYVVRKATLPYEVAVFKNINFVGTATISSTVSNNENSFLVTALGGNAFERCTGLTSITIPNSVTSIGSSAFAGCTGLTSITIPNSVSSLGSSAFSGCFGLTSVTISNSVTSISGFAFNNCTGLTSITIPNSITNIVDFAFFNSGLTTVNIPSSVTVINRSAFGGCSSLTSVTVNWLTPVSIDNLNVFDRLSTKTLNVPVGTEAAYKAAAVWKDFGTVATLGTNSFSLKNNISFYPNPAQSQITFSQEINSLEVFDISGKKIKTFQNTSSIFDVSALEKGVYVLKGKTNDGKSIKEKLVKE